MLLEWIKVILSALSVFIALVAAFQAIHVFRSNVHLQRAKWISELYTKFYSNDSQHNEIRRLIDDGRLASDETKIKNIQSLIKNQDDKLYEYLGFFEYVVYLKNTGQISSRDIKATFGYYIDQLRHPELMKEIGRPELSFENLQQYLANSQ
jgi:hypothetical protein